MSNTHAAPRAQLLPPSSNALTVIPAADHTIHEFTWASDEDVIIPEQRPVAAYLNATNDLVMRQQGFLGEDDDIVIVAAANVAHFLDVLTDIGGVPTMGR